MKEKAYITGEVLKWSRETAKFSLDDIAQKMKCNQSVIQAWENGSDYPTIKQAEKLAKIYDRSLAVFFLPFPPNDFVTINDFRKRSEQREFSTSLTFILREIQSKQSWIKELLLNDSELPLDFIGRFNSNSSTKDIANDIINELDIDQNVVTTDILKYWIEKAESKRIFVSLSSNINSHMPISIDEVRGFVISDMMAPFIFINSKDSKNAQLFTLIHEIAHLWLNTSGISNINSIEFREQNQFDFDPIEYKCNEITAEVLMPVSKIMTVFNKSQLIDINQIDKASKLIKVSSYALVVRLFNLNMISKSQFYYFKEILERRYKDFLEKESLKEKTGHVDPYLLKLRRNSRAFTQYVYDFYKGGKITGIEASNVLKLKLNKFHKIESLLYI